MTVSTEISHQRCTTPREPASCFPHRDLSARAVRFPMASCVCSVPSSSTPAGNTGSCRLLSLHRASAYLRQPGSLHERTELLGRLCSNLDRVHLRRHSVPHEEFPIDEYM